MKGRIFTYFSVLAFLVLAINFGTSQCDEAIALTELPNASSMTCTTTNAPTGNLNSTNVPGTPIDCGASGGTISASYKNGLEALYTYVPATDGMATITVDGTTWTAIFVYDGCPTTGTYICGARSTGASRSVTVNVTAQTTYYIWIDTWPPPASPCATAGSNWTITGPAVYVAPPPPPPTAGPGCILVCSGDQNVTLAPGACTYTIPNLVTMAGTCEPTLIAGPSVSGFSASPFNVASFNAYAGLCPDVSMVLNTANVTVTATELTLVSSDPSNAGIYFGTVVFSDPMPFAGTLSFDWDYTTTDSDAYYDPFGYQINGGCLLPPQVELANGFGVTAANGTVNAAVAAGDIVSWVVYTQDYFGGASTTVISNLVLQAPNVLQEYEIVQTSVEGAGSVVGPGTYTLSYDLFDPASGTVLSSCEFDVTVSAFTAPTNTLSCKQGVNISADENCEVTFDAGMFLSGSQYTCYSDYQLILWPNNSESNKFNVAQDVAYGLPCGTHTMEVMDASGNKCWGTFVIEDKLAPVVECNCVDAETVSAVTSFGGSLDLTDGIFARCNGFSNVHYDVFPFQVSVTGSYTFNANGSLGDTYAYIYSGSFDPASPCTNVIASNDDGAGDLDPLITVNLTAGVQYYYVFTDYFTTPTGTYNVTITTTSGGQVLAVTNAADAPECQFKCYDLDVVRNETVAMLSGASQNKAVLTTMPAASDACGAMSMSFEDVIETVKCGDTKLRRSWTYTDAKGNKAYCTQTFTFGAITVADITPPQYLVELSCGVNTDPANIAALKDVDSRPQPSSSTNIGAYYDDWAQTPTVTELHEGYAHGYFTYQQIGYDGNYHAQKVDPNICEIFTTYTDTNYPACGAGCGGNMKVVREWRILDWCSQDVFGYLQVIKAVDDKAPTFAVKDATVSVDPWGCVATYRVDNPWELQDNCAKPEELTWTLEVPAGVSLSGVQGSYVLTGLTKGTHTITYIATDCCGNVGTAEATITVIDASAPVAVAKQYIVMSLTGSGTAADGAAKLYGHQLDNGSYDHCTDVAFEVRRVDGGSCGNVGVNNHNNNSTFNGNNFASEVPGAVWFHPMDSRYTNADGNFDTDGGEFVKFCCDDIPEGEEYGLHDVELRVWDDGNMNGVYGDNLIIDGMKDNYNTTWVTVRVENKLAPVLVCPADVTVTCDMELNLSVGKDTKVTDVDLTMTGYPSAYDLCKGLDITYRDAWIGTYDEICKSGTIRRTFKATKGSVSVTCVQYITVTTVTFPFVVTFPQDGQTTPWDKCGFSSDDLNDQNNSLIKRPVVNNGPCDIIMENVEIDTFLNENGACKKWRVTYNYLNWCTQETSGPWVHYYTFKDVEAPILTCNNQMFAANPLAANPDGACYASVVLEASATDTLICAEESWIKWQVFADLWANGTVDRLGSSFINKAYNGIWVYIPRILNGSVNPAWTTMQNLHPNLVLADDLYVTYVKPTAASGGKATLPAFNLLAENINHKVLWKVTDGCGNVDQCESTVMSVDKKAPTPYCVSVHTAIMQTNPKMVELWAVDFNKGSFDNCTPQSKLYYTFEGTHPVLSRLNQEHYFKGLGQNATVNEYNQGKAYRWLPASRSAGYVWLTAGTHAVNVSVWDEAWNTDFCTVNLQINDNDTGGNSRPITGKVETPLNLPVNGVNVVFTSDKPESPMTVVTGVSGTYSDDAETGITYDITANKGGDYLNGVTTFDLVLIQRHILGIQPLTNPYLLIAADADNNGVVSVNDLSELRKLILGVYTELPSNESWRFPVASQTMDATHPFPYVETITVANHSQAMSNQDFVAVKIGDVNGNADASANNPVESRTAKKVGLAVADQALVAGETVRIPVTASNYNEIFGYQFTMGMRGAEFVDVESGALSMSASNVGVFADKLTMSYASQEAATVAEGEVLFTLVLKSKGASSLSEVLSLGSEITPAESYIGKDMEVGKVSLEVRGANAEGFAVYQNEPNPFRTETVIRYNMPEAAAATITVYDVAGKVVALRNVNAVKGMNAEKFTRADISASGVLMYKVESGDNVASKKMIIIE